MSSIETVFARIEGWLHPKEGKLLFQLARECQGRGAIVEIGSWKGKSTICLAHGSRMGQSVKVHAIDPHTGSPEHSKMYGEVWTFDEFRRNIEDAGLTDVVVPHVDFSTSVADYFNDPVEVIFIDGLHEYEGVKADFEAWFPKVIEGGTIAFHDTTCWPGVLKLVTESVFKSQQFRRVRFAKSIVYGEKVAQNTALERAANRMRLLLFRFHAWTDRVAWRLVHNYLDSRFTRAVVAYLKKRRQARVLGHVLPSGTGNERFRTS